MNHFNLTVTLSIFWEWADTKTHAASARDYFLVYGNTFSDDFNDSTLAETIYFNCSSMIELKQIFQK